MTLPTWLTAIIAYLTGRSAQRAADAAATTQETADALQQRATVDDAVRREPDASARDGLWKLPPGGNP